MKQLLNIIFIFSFLGIYSQIDTTKAIIGEWTLKAYKSNPGQIDWNEEIESKVIIKSDSLLKLTITKDSIHIFRYDYYGIIDTFSYSYHLFQDTSKYSSKKKQLIITPNKKDLKKFKKSYRKQFKQINFRVNKITNSQLNLETFSVENNYPINPFFSFSNKEYSFQKNKFKSNKRD